MEQQLTRGVGAYGFGGPAELVLVDLPVKRPGPDEVRIRVAACAVNPIDLMMRAGDVAQLMSDYSPPYIFGYDASGTIDMVGGNVDRLAAGDRVMAVVSPFGAQTGAYQEALVVHQASVVAIPEQATLAEAATLPMNGLTAIATLDALDLRPGSSVLVSGGAGWLASLTIGIGKRRGLRMIADAKHADRSSVLASGADEVIDRNLDLVAQLRNLVPDGVDAVIDTARIGPSLLSAVRDGGARAIVRAESAFQSERDIRLVPVTMMTMLRNTAALNEIRSMATSGHVPMRVFKEFSADQAAAAHQMQEGGGVRGRIILRFAQ